jgi:thermostable 8-oxoguanine DNA glycosylase
MTKLIKLRDPNIEWAAKLKEAKENYKYQPELTKKLDTHSGDFSETNILEIVLWKTNRYPTITNALISDINELRKNCTEEKARKLLINLLDKKTKGFDLPMASTVLRFACPNEFQIIDQRVYRLITPEKECLKIPYNLQEKIELYFDYINRLRNICKTYNIEFRTSDRVLYQADKTENNGISIKH